MFLKNKYPNVPIGYSDPPPSIIPCISAIAKGASIIEKHFTESKKEGAGYKTLISMDGKDLNFLNKSVKFINLMVKTKQSLK